MIFLKEKKYFNIRKKIIIYGCGEWLSYRFGWFKRIDDIIAFSDKNINKRKEIESLGYNFIEPEKINELKFDNLIITSEIYYHEILNELCKKYFIPAEKILRGEELWRDFENLCDGITKIWFGNKNMDRIFYIIAPLSSWSNNGLLNLANKVYYNTCYAIEKEYIPIIDMKNFYTIYHQYGELGEINIWNKYYKFKNVSYDLDDVYNSQNVIFCFSKPNIETYEISKINFTKYNFYKFFEESLYIKQEIKNAYKKIFGQVNRKKERILGVAIRGSDYNLLKPKEHPIQPNLDLIRKKVDEVIKQWEIDYIYVISEEKKSIDFMYSIYGEKVLTYECPLYDNFDKDVIGKTRFPRENDGFLRGKEYLISVMLLSYCNCLLSGINSKIIFLLENLKVKFEEILLIDLGKY